MCYIIWAAICEISTDMINLQHRVQSRFCLFCRYVVASGNEITICRCAAGVASMAWHRKPPWSPDKQLAMNWTTLMCLDNVSIWQWNQMSRLIGFYGESNTTWFVVKECGIGTRWIYCNITTKLEHQVSHLSVQENRIRRVMTLFRGIASPRGPG